MTEKLSKDNRIIRFLTYIYILPLAVMFLFNTGNSLLRTTYFELYKDMETAKYRWDNPLFVILGAAVLFALVFFLSKLFNSNINANRLLMIVLFISGILCLALVLIIRCEVTCDSAHLSRIAIEFMQGNYTAFDQGEYLYNYSFQIGLAAFLELLYRLFGIENYLVFQFLNVAAILIFLFLLNKTTSVIFKDEAIVKTEAILSVFSLPLFLFSTFVYGDIIGWAFGAGAIYLMLRYLDDGKVLHVIMSSVLLMFGVIVKSNINIVLVAMIITLILDAIYQRRIKNILLITVVLILSQVGLKAIEIYYASRVGLPSFPRGIPKIAWIAMSFQETDEGGYAPGWYNAYNWAVYSDNGYDRAATTAACLADLKQSMHKLLHEQRYALNYLYKKFTSAWNAPTFQAMITNEWGVRHLENRNAVADYLVYGKGRDILYGLMNIWHLFVFLFSTVSLFIQRKKWTLQKAGFVLVIFGGFLFHMIWETQSRYILGYFTLMLPLAACGVSYVMNEIAGKIYNHKKV